MGYNGGPMSTLLGLAVLVLDVWAILRIWRSSASTGKKVLWTVLVILFPVVGLVVWFFVGPGGR